MGIEQRRCKYTEKGVKQDKKESVQLPRGSGLCRFDVARERETRGVKERKGERAGGNVIESRFETPISFCLVSQL